MTDSISHKPSSIGWHRTAISSTTTPTTVHRRGESVLVFKYFFCFGKAYLHNQAGDLVVNIWFFISCPSSSMPTLLTNWVTEWLLIHNLSMQTKPHWFISIVSARCVTHLWAYIAAHEYERTLPHTIIRASSIQTKPHWFISIVSAQGCTHLWAHIAAHNCERTLPHTIISAKWSKSSQYFFVFRDSPCCKHLFATRSVWLSD